MRNSDDEVGRSKLLDTVLREQRYGIVSVTEERLKRRGYRASESRDSVKDETRKANSKRESRIFAFDIESSIETSPWVPSSSSLI